MEFEEESVDCNEDGEENTKTDILRQFIEMYEKLPELWNSSSDKYKNKMKRNEALDKLLVIFRNIKPDAVRADVRKKLNTLRSNYRKELKKVIQSKRSGAGTDDVYNPTSWVFYALKFLNDTETPISPNSLQQDVAASINEGQAESVQHEESSTPQSQGIYSRSSIDPSPTPTPVEKRRKRTIGPIARQNELLQRACSFLENSPAEQKAVPTVAIMWGEKLEQLDPQQRIFAEKGISDILFEASLGTLHRNSILINQGVPNFLSPSTGSNLQYPSEVGVTSPSTNSSSSTYNGVQNQYVVNEHTRTEQPGGTSMYFSSFMDSATTNF